jgi:hypothetical protein
MRLNYLSLIVMVMIISCNTTTTKPDLYKTYVLNTSAKDTTTEKWLTDKDPSNSIFINSITLKDGQGRKAGLSFIMQMDTVRFAVSAKHLVGKDGGFEQNIQPDRIDEVLKDWKMTALKGNEEISAAGISGIDAISDVLLLNIPRNVKPKSRIFELSKITIPVNTTEVTIQYNGYLNKLPNIFYLVGYDESNQEQLYELEYAGTLADQLLFRKKSSVDFHGLSGGPIVDCKGHVFAILSGAINDNGEEMIIGTKIRPVYK